jgi:hypothetical protein
MVVAVAGATMALYCIGLGWLTFKFYDRWRNHRR